MRDGAWHHIITNADALHRLREAAQPLHQRVEGLLQTMGACGDLRVVARPFASPAWTATVWSSNWLMYLPDTTIPGAGMAMCTCFLFVWFVLMVTNK